jgi:hypothetical protein
MSKKRAGSPDNIHIIKDFLSSEEVALAKSLVDSHDWRAAVDPNSTVYILKDADKLRSEMKHLNIEERVTELASYTFGMNLSFVDNMGGFQMRKPGDFMRVHTDAENFEGESRMNEVLHLNFAKAMTMYAALLYIGEEFGEGQLYFPSYEVELDIDVKPGDLVMFPTSSRYPHGVRKTTYGNRCVFTMYFTIKRLHDAYMDMFRLVSTHSDYTKNK